MEGDGVSVRVGVLVREFVRVGVDVEVMADEPVGVGVRVKVRVHVGVPLGVKVGVEVPAGTVDVEVAVGGPPGVTDAATGGAVASGGAVNFVLQAVIVTNEKIRAAKNNFPLLNDHLRETQPRF